MEFGKHPCTCMPGPVINGHETWIIDKNCPVHAKGPISDSGGKKKKK